MSELLGGCVVNGRRGHYVREGERSARVLHVAGIVQGVEASRGQDGPADDGC
jgi:hypothetical protein